jgi:hypothetical protein
LAALGRLQAALDAFALGSVLGESVPMGGGVSATTMAFEAVFPDVACKRFIAEVADRASSKAR